MARKNKDLFVLLKERMNRIQGGGEDAGTASTVSRKSKKGTGRKAASRPADPGGGVGDWFRSIMRVTRPPKPGRPRQKARGKRVPQPRVPRGLLVQGWLPVVLLVFGLGAAFMLGRWTAGGKPQAELRVDEKKIRERMAVFPEGGSSGDADRPVDKKPQPRLSKYFIPVLEFPPAQAGQAARLAEYLRNRGITKARFTRVRNDQGKPVSLTLCYIDPASGDDVPFSQSQVRETLDRLAKTPAPTFAKAFGVAVQKLGSLPALQVVREFH